MRVMGVMGATGSTRGSDGKHEGTYGHVNGAAPTLGSKLQIASHCSLPSAPHIIFSRRVS